MLSDGFRVPGLPTPSLPVIGGDAAAACIAAASVLAKVSRDRLMVAMDDEHPGYGFAEHKGYSTRAHGAALAFVSARLRDDAAVALAAKTSSVAKYATIGSWGVPS